MAPRLFPARGLAPIAPGPKSLFAPADTKAAAVQLPPERFWLPGSPWRDDLLTTADTITTGGAYGASTLVYACMLFRARKLAEAPLWLADEEDGNESWVEGTTDHPLSALFEQPNPDQHAAAFLSELSLAMDLGRTLVVKNRDRAGRVASLYVFTFDQFTVEPAVVDGVPRLYGKFVVTDADGRPRPVDPADCLYFAPLGGVSPVDAALAHVRISDRMRRAIKASLAQSMRPGSVTTVNGEIQDDQFERYKASLGSLYSGEGATGKNIVLAGQDVKFQKLAASLKDLELGPVQGDVEAAICQAFAIHPALVGAKIALENSSGLSDSLKPALSLFYDLAAFPRWAEIETAFTAGLLREVDPSPVRFVRFVKDDIRALAPDLTANVAVAKNATGIATLDEQRAMIALPPKGPTAGGDVIAAPQTTPQRRADDAAGAAQQGTQPVKTRRAAIEAKALRTDADRAAYWAAFDAKAARRTPRYEAAARQLFAAERAGVLATLRAAVPKAARMEFERKAETKDDGGLTDEQRADRLRAAFEGPYLEAAELQIAADYAENGPYAQAWADEFGALLKATMEGAADEFVAGVGVSFSMDNPAMVDAIRQRAAALVQHVTDTTKAQITEAIATGRAEGLTIEQIAARVDERAFGAMARARAQTIANTEVVGAINDAEWTAAGESGVFRSKRWIHTRRPGQRDDHEAHETEGEHGGWVPLDYRYTYAPKGSSPGGTMLRPFDAGLPARQVVHCGCTVAYSDVDPAQAQEEG